MNRQIGLDVARITAAYLVLFGHFAFGGTLATDDTFRRWAGHSEPLPLLDQTRHVLWLPDMVGLTQWGTASAIIGVGLFFIISGWIVPPMLHRYRAIQFILNRVFRIFPMLIFAVLLAAAIQYGFGNWEQLTMRSVLCTAFLVNQLTLDPPTLGVTWTLVIEVKFYLIIVFVGALSSRKIYLLNIAVAAFMVAVYFVPHPGLKMMAHDLMFVSFMLIGAACWLASKGKGVGIVLLSLAAFNVLRLFTIDALGVTPYQDINPISQVIIFALFSGCLWIHRGRVNEKSAMVIGALSNPTYSLYLVHLSVGIFLLSRLRHMIENQYALLAIVTIIVSLLSALTYILIEKPWIALGRRALRAVGSGTTGSAAS